MSPSTTTQRPRQRALDAENLSPTAAIQRPRQRALEEGNASPPSTVQRPRQRARRPRPLKVHPAPESQEPSLTVRSAGPIDKCKAITMSLSEPAADEECGIGLVPIADYRLSFMPPDHKASVLEDRPALTKASLPCGHGFNALALLYHFAKNSMTCPFCRAGHDKERMGVLSIPAHVRAWFTSHLEGVRADENREQIAMDAITATRILEQEVSIGVSMPMTRVVLLLYAYASGDNRAEPTLVLELPLTSSLTLGTLEFASSGYSLAQVNLSLLRFPSRPVAFEIGVGLQNMLRGSLSLFRTVRFPATGPHSRIVFAQGNMNGEPMAIEVESLPSVQGLDMFARLSWTVSVATFSSIIIASASGRENDVIAAV